MRPFLFAIFMILFRYFILYGYVKIELERR